jgi:site-specific recombinase XerD
MKKKKNPVFSINFRLNKQRAKNGKNAIYLRVTVDKKRTEIATKQYIEPKLWDQKLQCVRGVTEEAGKVNRVLNIMKADLQKHYNRLDALDQDITAELLKNEYIGIEERQRTLRELLDFYYTRFKEKVSSGKKAEGTLKNIHTTNEKLKEFVKYQFRVSDIFLIDLKVSFVSNFEHFLTTKQGLSNNSAMKYIYIFKRITKFAIYQAWMGSNPVAQFRCSYQEPTRDRLTMDEIMVLYKKEFSTKRLAQVRDVFIFCCFTGFSYLDVYNLTPQHIVNGIDGCKWVVKERQKTKNVERVPVLPIALEIIERYKDDYYCQVKNCLLPVSTNQCYNGYLKEVAVLCGIEKYLTTHVARHTFATTVTLENDVPIETVSQMLGHKSIKTTQIYAKVTQRKMSNNMKVLEEKLRKISSNSGISKESH